MKMSRRAKRMSRHFARNKKQPALNLVSLMDIFTILVFFLMVNQSDVKVLESNDSIKLPESQAESLPEEALVIFVNKENILVQGRSVAKVSELNGSEALISSLRDELLYQASKQKLVAEGVEQEGRPITIAGDKEIPYNLLKRIMATCADANYTDISLAVNRKASKEV
ncbi:biopolymer transporter ExbD [Litoribacillus peritrichatus]|uniref:RNA polymerase subunit sigma-70 n=1 Tax=Litoribacillus peritrichatus TaxID=718191 RepID=A0ABP7N7K9_9GAMM